MFNEDKFINLVGIDFLTKLKESIYEGFDAHNISLDLIDKELGIIASKKPAIYAKPILHFIVTHAKKNLIDLPGVKFRKINQKDCLVIEQYAISFNKLDRERNKAPNLTHADREYRNGQLFGDNRLIPLYAGFIPDANWRNIINTYVLYRSGSTACLKLEDLTVEQQLVISYRSKESEKMDKQDIKTTQKVNLKISAKKDQQKE